MSNLYHLTIIINFYCMKKLYTILAAAALAFSANAQIYLVGSGEGLDWTPETPMTVNLENNAYTVTINNLVGFKISTAMGDWDTFNGSAVTCAITEETLGQPIELTAGDGDINTPWVGTYTLVISADVKTMTVTTTTPKPSGPAEIYIRGSVNEWNNLDGWQFVFDADKNAYYFDCIAPHNIPMGAEFKVADANWGNINYGAAGAVYADDFGSDWNYNAGNAVMSEDYAGTIEVTLPTVVKAPATVILHPEIIEHGGAGVADITVDANAPKEYFNLQGIRVANPTEGLYIVRQGKNVTKTYVK